MEMEEEQKQNPVQTSLVNEDMKNEENISNIKSYGIEIKRQKIKSIPLAEQDEALKDLGVSAYEQEVFEEGVLKQVDEEIERQRIEISKDSLQRDLNNIRLEFKECQNEIEKIEKRISAFTGSFIADDNARRGLDSLKCHRDIKRKQLQKLEAREKSTVKKLNDIEVQAKTIGNRYCSVNNQEEFQPYLPSDNEDDLTLYNNAKKALTSVGEANESSSFKHLQTHDKYDRIKSRKRQLKIQDEFSDDYSTDEEFIPYPDEVSDELTDEDDERVYRYNVLEKKAKLSKPNKKHKPPRTALKGQKLIKPKRVADDGDIKVFNERIRILHSKKKLNKNVNSNNENIEDEADNVKEISLNEGFSLPVHFWKMLYKYQRTGVKWLWQLHCQDVGGIIGDEMGLGKTIQVIAFLTGLKNSKTDKTSLGPTLIVCPATMLHQWVKEFHKWSPEFRVAILHETGSYAGRKDALIRHIINDKEVLVTSYSNLRIHQNELLRYAWDYVILDEGHRIRNPDAEITLVCKQFQTTHRLILSGSPLQNNLKELWSLFDFIFPGKLGTLPVFMTEFSVPITSGGYSNATSVQVETAYKCACILRDTISPYLLRRMKKDVNQSLQLPSKNEQVLFCRLSDEQKDLYKKYISSRDVSSILAGKMKVFPGLIMLRKICNHPDLTSAAGSLDWMKQNEVAKKEEANHPIQYQHGYGHWSRSGKMIVVESLLKLWKQQGHRVLLFSQTRQMLEIMESFVKMDGYTYLRMDGSTSVGSRQPIVDRFNQDKSIFVFLLTTRVGGIGLNLTGANRIIIYDPDWNPSTDIQARERSWRIGQDKHVTIYRLLTTGTIEEKIYHRQIFKQFLTNRVLKNPAQRRFFKSNDLHELFTLGDEKANRATETSAIFAGIGSQVDIRPGSSAKQSPRSVTVVLSKQTNECSFSRNKNKSSSHQNITENMAEKVRDVWKINKEDTSSVEESSKNSSVIESEKCERNEKNIDCDKKNAASGSNDVAVSSMKDTVDEQIIEIDTFPNNAGKERKRRMQQNIERQTNNEISTDKTENYECYIENTTNMNDGLMEHSQSAKDDNPSRDMSSEQKQKKISKKKDKKKKRKRKQIKYAKIDGEEINYLIKSSVLNHESRNESYNSGEKADEEHDDEILLSLFKNNGIHSVLKHDKIVESGNPDYILVEREAERVAKQASEALCKSRALCRSANIGVPTWTGCRGRAGFSDLTEKRFGPKASINDATIIASADEVNNCLFNGNEILGNKSTKESISSKNLLKQMRARSALTGKGTSADVDTRQYSVHCRNNTARENLLVENIRDFIAFKARNSGQATTDEVLQEFKHRIEPHENALFKELLKQICDFHKVNGVGIWYLKNTFR